MCCYLFFMLIRVRHSQLWIQSFMRLHDSSLKAVAWQSTRFLSLNVIPTFFLLFFLSERQITVISEGISKTKSEEARTLERFLRRLVQLRVALDKEQTGMKSPQVNAKAAPANESYPKTLLSVVHCQGNVLSATQEVAFTPEYLASGEQHSNSTSFTCQ